MTLIFIFAMIVIDHYAEIVGGIEMYVMAVVDVKLGNKKPPVYHVGTGGFNPKNKEGNTYVSYEYTLPFYKCQ